ncbi:ABC transporter permease [Pedococcus sp. P5_B7]
MTLTLGGYAFALTMVMGIGLGVVAATRPGSVLDRLAVGLGVVGLSAPAFVVGVVLLYLFSIQLEWFPAFGRGSGVVDELWHLTLPAFALALTSLGYVLNHTRSAMLGVLDQDYIVFARARGLSAARVLIKYSLRNALIPIVTISGIVLSSLITGAVLVEATFSVQGLGELLVQSANAKDLPVLQSVALLVAVSVMACNLLADIVYLLVDPRIRARRV